MSDQLSSSPRGSRRYIRRQRRRRFFLRMDVFVSMVLSGVLLLMVNYLSFRYFARTDVSKTRYYSLSSQTTDLLNHLENPVEVYLLLRKGHPSYEDIDRILREYSALSDRLRVHWVDLQRDFALMEELKARFELDAADVVLLAAGQRRRILHADDFFTEETSGLNEVTPIRSFRGEQLITSALQELSQGRSARVYFTVGHGEHSLESFSEQRGYSGIARFMKQENLSAASLSLGQGEGVPKDADAVVIAGPSKSFSASEVDSLGQYMARGGRCIVLLDAFQGGGLEKFLDEWGVQVRDDLVVDGTRTLTGKELFLTAYESHPITDRLTGLTSVFYLPRSVRLSAQTPEGADGLNPSLHLVPLAACSENGWAETNMDENPKRFDPLSDTPGPVAVAVAIERGASQSVDVNLAQSRMVVFGDSDFISNAGLNGGDVDFFMNALDWVLERELLISIRPREIETVKLVLDQESTRKFILLVAGGLPACAGLLGFLVWFARRRL